MFKQRSATGIKVQQSVIDVTLRYMADVFLYRNVNNIYLILLLFISIKIVMLNSKSNSILIRKTKTYSITVTSSQSQHANAILQCQLLSHCHILYTDFRNNSLWSVSSAIWHLRAVRICATALNSRSTAAELGRVALLLGAIAKGRHS